MAEHAPEPNATAEAAEFRCDACGGRMVFDAARGCLACEFCGATRAVGEADAERTVVEYDLEQGLAAHARGYGVEVRTVRCEQCGAVVSYGGIETARRCDFCGSPQVLEQADRRAPLRPESVVPFSVDRATATARFSAWLGKLWFRPSSLKQLARLSHMAGMYVPYWAFDAAVRSEWTAEAGHYYYVTETYTTRGEGGKSVQRSRQVRRVRWQPAWGSRRDRYDDVLVCGSKGLPASLAQNLEPFDTSRLCPYEPSYLAGWQAEEYSVDLNAAWKNAIGIIEQSQRQRCAGDVPGDTQRHLHVVSRFSDEKFKHILLPIWIMAYQYRERPYRLLINGQTGEVTGEAPYSVIKLTLLAIAILIVAFVIVALQGR